MKTKFLLFALLFACSAAKLSAQCPATFTYTAAPAGLVSFTSTGANTPSTVYYWDFGNGTYGSGQNATATYTNPGTYTACLFVEDTFSNCMDSSCQTIQINGAFVCQANFYIYEDSLAAPHTYIGVNTSVYPAGATFNWAWGDGTYATGFNPPAHTYAAAGMYNICLVVMGGGCVDTFCSNENINKQAADMLSVTFGAAPASVSNFDKSSANHVYPNPANNQLFIQGEKSSQYMYEIYTISGSKVLSGVVAGNEAVDVSSLSTNLYMVRIADADGKRQYAKFTKQ